MRCISQFTLNQSEFNQQLINILRFQTATTKRLIAAIQEDGTQ
jgi:hypothetical protein